MRTWDSREGGRCRSFWLTCLITLLCIILPFLAFMAWWSGRGLCDEIEPTERDEQWLEDDVSGRVSGTPEIETTRAHTPGDPPTLYLYVLYDSPYPGTDYSGNTVTYHMVGGLIYTYVPGEGYSYVGALQGGGSNIPEQSLDYYLGLAREALDIELEDKRSGWPDTEEMGEIVPEEGEEDATGTTDGGEEETGTTEPPEGTREAWWGAVVSLLVGMTALFAAAGPFLFSLLSRNLSVIPSMPAQVGASLRDVPSPEALQMEQEYQPLVDGAVLTYDVAGPGDDVYQALHERLSEIKKSIPPDRAPALDRIWDDYLSGDIGKDKVELIAGLLRNKELPLEKVNESYDLFLKWERSRADKAGMVMKEAVVDLAKSKLDPLGFAQGKVADEAERVGRLIKDKGMLRMAKAFGRYSQIGDAVEYTKFAIKSGKAAGFLMEEADYPHFDEYVKQMNVSDQEVADKLAETRRQIEDYTEKLMGQKELQKKTSLSLTDGDTAQGVRANQEIREELERIDRMAEIYEDILDDLSIEERVYMVRNRGDAPVLKSVKPGDRFVRPDIGGIEIH